MKIPEPKNIAQIMRKHLPVFRHPLTEWQARWFVSRLENWTTPFYTAQDARALGDLRDKAEALGRALDALPATVRERFAGSMLMNRNAEGLAADAERLGEQIAALVEVAGFLRREADQEKGRADRNNEGIAVTACAWQAWESGDAEGRRQNPPSGMREAPFLDFLQDLLLACEIESEARSSFNAFVKWAENHR